MRMSLRQTVRDWLPPALARVVRRQRRHSGFAGDHGTWAEARAASHGYENPCIFEKTLAAACAVRDGRAAWERDGVTFSDPAAHWTVLACLLRVAALHGGRLHVIDYGGAFGSLWWQHRAWLHGLDVRWIVVEQPHIVEAGRRGLTVGPLSFCDTLDEAIALHCPATLLLSSVLPYLEQPHTALGDAVARKFQHIIVDRTGFVTDRARDRLTVQTVPPEIYAASYPCWFFDRVRFGRHFEETYRLVGEWENSDDVNIAARFRGMLWDRRAS